MATITEIGDGVRTTFRIPLKTGSATATVDGSPATISAQGPSFVTFSTAPGAGKVVVITYTPVVPPAASYSWNDLTDKPEIPELPPEGTAQELEDGTEEDLRLFAPKTIHDEIARQIGEIGA